MAFKVLNQSKVKLPKLVDHFKKLLDVEESLGVRDEFRVSSFPYCPILNATSDKERFGSFTMDYYTEVGTAVHLLYQRYLGARDTARGNWKCKKCGLLHGEGPIAQPLKCTNCKSKKFTYEEVTFHYKGLSGHLDFLEYFGKMKIAYDFKTTGAKYVENKFYNKFLPTPKHIWQLEMYCALLWLIYKVKVDYYNIIYINRDAPFDPKKTKGVFYIVEFTEEMRNRRIKQIELAVKGREAFKAGSVKGIIKNKPCKSRTDYLNIGMGDSFFGKECPLYANGKCFKPESIKKIVTRALKKKEA